MLLFILVTGAKTFHSHANEEAQGAGIVLSTSSGSCELCAFQLSRDGELPVQTELQLQPVCLQTPVVSITTTFFSEAPAYFSLRGPPAV